MKKYGYIRVSTKEQRTDRQLAAMLDFGIDRRDIYADRQSGRDFDRPEWERMLKKLKAGDVVAVQSIDRFGRNYKEILEQWRIITRKKKAAVVVLDMPLLDTRQSRDLTGKLIADIVLQLLSYVAETERAMIKKRQAEGIAAAKRRGVHCGRPKKPIPDDFERIYILWKEKKLTRKQAAKELGMQPYTFSRTVMKYEALRL